MSDFHFPLIIDGEGCVYLMRVKSEN